MSLHSIRQTEDGNEHVMLLKETEGKRFVPISIGLCEATAIAWGADGNPLPRPLTHDLMLGLIHRLQGKLSQVVIHDLRDETYICQLEIETERGILEIDCRPSDGVALAIRAKAPVYVTEDILEEAGAIPEE